MIVVINRYNVSLKPDEGAEYTKVLNFLHKHLTKAGSESLIKDKVPAKNGGKDREIIIGKINMRALYNIPVDNGFLVPINVYYTMRNALARVVVGEISETDNRDVIDPSRSIAVKTNKGWSPRDYQQDVLEFLDKENALANKIVGMPTGTGKEQPNHLIVPTPKGAKVWGDLREGDYLFGSDGKPTMIVGSYPQGVKSYFNVEFRDGSSTECGAEHLWTVTDRRTGKDSVMSLEDIIEDGMTNYKIPSNTKPVIYAGQRERSRYKVLQACSAVASGKCMMLPSWVMEGSVETRETAYAFLVGHHGEEYITMSPIRAIAVLELGRSLGKTLELVVEDSLYCIREESKNMKVFRAVRYKGETEQTCVKVSANDSLYMTSDYIITHNTCCIFFRMVKMKKATVIILRPFLMQQWEREAKVVLNLKDNDILKVTGKTKLMKVLEDSRNGNCSHKLYIISNKTYMLYLKSYFHSSVKMRDAAVKEWEAKQLSDEEWKELQLRSKDQDLYEQYMMKKNREREEIVTKDYKAKYPDVPPNELFKKMGVGLVVIDEAHLDPHLNNTIYSTMSNVEQQISLSATYFSSDNYLKRLMSWTFANYNNYDELKAKKYIEHMTYIYRHGWIDSHSYKVGPMYNHNKYESSYLIKAGQDILETVDGETVRTKVYVCNPKYVKMVLDIVNVHWYLRKIENSKCLLFFQSLRMVKLMQEILADAYPESNVVKYTGEEKSDKILKDADIIVATVGKAAVGLDLKDLITVINCISIKSAPLNVQILGRLRELDVKKYGVGYEVFVQLMCDSIHPHKAHHYERLPYIKDRTARMLTEEFTGVI